MFRYICEPFWSEPGGPHSKQSSQSWIINETHYKAGSVMIFSEYTVWQGTTAAAAAAAGLQSEFQWRPEVKKFSVVVARFVAIILYSLLVSVKGDEVINGGCVKDNLFRWLHCIHKWVNTLTLRTANYYTPPITFLSRFILNKLGDTKGVLMTNYQHLFWYFISAWKGPRLA